ncbi:flagellar hook-associated protein FlgK [Jeotgalibacillus marinus]|uniref:Flagellar hook-associated protein 1 n=1 Tax=Jeotgalibacillus marinus TaxID=86667 RepID=A0ABV3Q4I9_9BACL
MSTFSGLETAKRAIATQQSALYTTGHNIANANTLGYSRQTIDFQATNAFPTASMNSPVIAGQVGTGVEVGSIQRYRDSFLDSQYRQQSTDLGYWSSQATGLHRMEEVLNEPSDYGLSNVLNQFWSSLGDLATNPDDNAARRVVLERGQAVADTFNYLDDQLNVNKKNIGTQINNTEVEVNSLLNQINDLNSQIAKMEASGYLPNDLYDQRDMLVDDLSEHVNIKVSYTSSGGLSPASAQGKVTIELLDDQNKSMAFLVNGSVDRVNQIKVNMDDTQSYVTNIEVGRMNEQGTFVSEKQFTMEEFTSKGSLLGHIYNFGYTEDATATEVEVKGAYPEMISELNLLAYEFANAFNEVHSQGWNLEDIKNGEKGEEINFFDLDSISDPTNAAKNIKLSSDINADRIAAALPGEDGIAYAGNGDNALLLADVKDMELTFGSQESSVMDYYQGMIGKMGVQTSEAVRLGSNSAMVLESIQLNRSSVSSVSLDEEMVNLIQFQQAFNAASRNMTAVDEMLDTIINGMGLVGR